MSRKILIILLLFFAFFLIAIYVYLTTNSSNVIINDQNHLPQKNLQNYFIIPLYSNNPKTSWVLAVDPIKDSLEKVKLDTSGIRDIAIDTKGQYAYFATYGVDFRERNSYVMALSLENSSIHKVDIKDEGPQKIITAGDNIYLIAQDTDFSGYVIKIDPQERKMTHAKSLDGYLDALAFDESSLYVSSYFIDDPDNQSLENQTIIFQLDVNDLSLQKENRLSAILRSRDLLVYEDFLYSSDASNEDNTAPGQTITKIDKETLAIEERIEIDFGLNNLYRLPSSKDLLVLKNNEGVPDERLSSPYAYRINIEQNSYEPLENFPFLADLSFDSENILWGITYSGEIIKYDMQTQEIIETIHLQIKDMEKKNRDHVKIFSFDRGK